MLFVAIGITSLSFNPILMVDSATNGASKSGIKYSVKPHSTNSEQPLAYLALV